MPLSGLAETACQIFLREKHVWTILRIVRQLNEKCRKNTAKIFSADFAEKSTLSPVPSLILIWCSGVHLYYYLWVVWMKSKLVKQFQEKIKVDFVQFIEMGVQCLKQNTNPCHIDINLILPTKCEWIFRPKNVEWLSWCWCHFPLIFIPAGASTCVHPSTKYKWHGEQIHLNFNGISYPLVSYQRYKEMSKSFVTIEWNEMIRCNLFPPNDEMIIHLTITRIPHIRWFASPR